MTGPKRIQMSRQKPWRAENPDAIVVARPSRWGNPFKVGEPAFGPGTLIVRSRQHAVELYELHTGPMGNYELDLDEVRRALGGRDLACWCAASDRCHADWLISLANPELAAARTSPPTTAKEA